MIRADDDSRGRRKGGKGSGFITGSFLTLTTLTGLGQLAVAYAGFSLSGGGNVIHKVRIPN